MFTWWRLREGAHDVNERQGNDTRPATMSNGRPISKKNVSTALSNITYLLESLLDGKHRLLMLNNL